MPPYRLPPALKAVEWLLIAAYIAFVGAAVFVGVITTIRAERHTELHALEGRLEHDIQLTCKPAPRP